MAFDLDQLRLDIPPEEYSSAGGVRPFWRAAALALLAACVGLAAWHVIAPAPDTGAVMVPVQVVAPQPGSELTAFTAGGWVEPAWPCPVIISAELDGRLDKLEVVEGQTLKQGDLIAVLNNLPHRQELLAADAAVAEAEANVEAAEAALARLRAGARPEEVEVANAELQHAQSQLALLEAGYRAEEVAVAAANLRAARASAEQLQREADRTANLSRQQLLAPSIADRDRAAAEASQARTAALEAEYARMSAGPRPQEIAQARAAVQVAQARLALVQAGFRAEEKTEASAVLDATQAVLEAAEARQAAAKRDVGFCMVRAPFAGVVLDVVSAQGSWLHGEKRGIVRMYDPARMQARVDVRQENAALLVTGRACLVKLESRKDRPYAGRVTRMDPQGNLARDTVRVRVEITEPDELLRIDLTVTVDFLVPEAEPAKRPLVVPAAAVIQRDGRYHVFAVRGGQAHLLSPELGAQTPTGYVVVSGLEAGEVVATGNLAMLSEGTVVRIEGEP
ncbi:MAG: efflux RND transporter periplasmic adaptor subunit [Planctomycetes bacterium]|nr:efflux RND transporter periplasmic adaptor subunit [Planctomycetota bacterium]